MPYAESLGFWRKSSPYYTQSHDDFRTACREVYDREVGLAAVGETVILLHPLFTFSRIFNSDGERASAE